MQSPEQSVDFKCEYANLKTTHFPHAAAVPKEEEVPAAQVHGQNRAEMLEEPAHVPLEP